MHTSKPNRSTGLVRRSVEPAILLDAQKSPTSCRPAEDDAAPTPDYGTLTLHDFETWQQNYESSPLRQTLGTLLSQQDMFANLTTRRAIVSNAHVFNHKLSVDLSASHQQESGRCWLFAVLNMARYAMMKKYKLADFEFSQSYPFFYDQLNKANVFLEQMLEMAEDDLDSRLVSDLVSYPVGDGGYWCNAVDLIERYGLVPQVLCPESYNSSNSGQMRKLVNAKLREYCLELRRLYSLIKTTLSKSTDLTEDAVIKAAIKGCRALKTKQLGQIYIILATCMGTPQSPHKQFTYEFYDSEGEFQCIKMTPLELFADLGTAFAPGDHIVMEHFPHYQSGKLYLQEQTQNIQGAREHTFVNTEMEDLEHAVVRILKADMPVNFCCDVAAEGDVSRGILDVDTVDTQGAFGTSPNLCKADRLRVGELFGLHMMIITGVHIVDDKPVRYRVSNSWGPGYGKEGHFVVSAAWFKEHAFEVVVPKHLASDHIVAVHDAGNPIRVPSWVCVRPTGHGRLEVFKLSRRKRRHRARSAW